uniref:Putative TPR domain protein n=1 Tax=uncultured marine microorganism HF4000_008G09 TaxID=455513 RepID=B3T160_9ZZZZ|nr:putative TPR domain protein [uncultured marine microorganism HF4000_008G09]
MNTNVLKRFIIYLAILTFVMFTVWALIRSFMNRPPGDYETEVCDIRLKDKKYDEAVEAADIALKKMPNHRGAIMCKALVYISQKQYREASDQLDYLINFLEKNLEDDDKTGIGTLAAAYANRGIIKDRKEDYEGALKDYVKALGIDYESVAGPGLGTVILNYKFKSSSVKERALYLNEQLQLPENERILKIEELDEGQVMHKPGKL